MRLNRMQWAVSVAAVVGLVGCGGEDTRLYDVELDAAALSDVPISCIGDVQTPRGPARVAARQRWVLRNAELSSTSLEVPDIAWDLPMGRYGIDDDAAPDVLPGTSSEAGPFQFVDLRTEGTENYEPGNDFPPYQRMLRFFIEQEGLDDDTVQGFIWIRSEYYELLPADGFIPGQCTATIPFTGRRVKE